MHSSNDYRAQIYERYASRFQDRSDVFDRATADRWASAYRYHLRGLLPETKDAAILEAACGSGFALHLLQREGYRRVRGIDISPEQVALARQTGAEVEQADALTYLEQHVGAYDLILGFDIVEHFHKPEVMRFLRACFASLRGGGRLILQTPNGDSPWGSMHRYNDFTHEVGFNPNSLGRLLRLQGFVDVAARELGPVPLGHSAVASGRYVLWQTLRAGLKLWNLVETGDAGSGIFTRVFLISAVKPA